MTITSERRSRFALNVGIPVTALLMAVVGLVPFDLAIASISVMFSVALVPGILENFRNKRGWSKDTTTITASGLLSMGTMFILLGLTFTGATTFVSGLLWVVLTVQAFVYGGKQ